MSGSIRTNIGALAALNSIALTAAGLNTSGAQLSTGLAINSPEDNPAGYITAHGFTSEIGGMSQAISNANEGISLSQTAQGAIQQQIAVAQHLYSIAVQAANGTQTGDDRQDLQGVAQTLIGSINSIATQTRFNGINLLDGSFRGVPFQTGADAGQNSLLSIDATDIWSIGATPSQAWLAETDIPQLGKNVTPTWGMSSSAIQNTFMKQGRLGSGTVDIQDNDGQGGSFSVEKSTSAYGLAQKINNTGANVQATASTSIQMKLLPVSASGPNHNQWYFSMMSSASGAGRNSSVDVGGHTQAALIASINAKTAQTGITAQAAGSSSMILSQAKGLNIILGVSVGVSNNMVSASGVSAEGGNFLIQGQVKVTSSSSFTLTNGNLAGLSPPKDLPQKVTHYLGSLNLTTQTDADQAISTVEGSIQELEQTAAKVGAFSDGLSSAGKNLSVSVSQATTSLGAVQDANIPKVTNNLSDDQIRAQTGVAALKDSAALQQSFLSLLP